MSYCALATHPVHQHYHDHEYGFPNDDERVLCERLILEVMQAGLSWELVLRRRSGMAAALNNFMPDKIASYDAADLARLLKDERLIRNRLKLQAVIHNANQIIELRKEGGFASWLAAHHPRSRTDWVKLFRRRFKFMGPEIVGEFLQSLGYLPGAHQPDCPVYQRLLAIKPPWLAAQAQGFVSDDFLR